MGRRAFRWVNLPLRVQIELAGACGLDFDDDDPARALKTAFRTRPQDWFVAECWSQLRDAWLANDDASRALIVGELQDRGLGDWQRRPRSLQGELNYLATCRAGAGLKDVVLRRFIAVGSTPRVAPDTSTSSGTSGSDRYRRFRTVVCGPEAPTSRRKPFDHQREAWESLDQHRPLEGLLVLPTGAGKTFTAVHWLLENILSDPKPRHVLWLAHRAELLEQAAGSFVDNAAVAMRSEPLSIRTISGKHGAPIATLTAPADVTLCTVQALSRHLDLVAKYFTMYPDAVIVIDEAHHAAATSYRKILAEARSVSRSFELLGLTATPTRTDEREIGFLNAMFKQGVLYQIPQSSLIDREILSRPVIETVPTGEDFEVEFTARERQYVDRFGDLHPDTLKRIARSNSRNSLIVDRYAKHREAYGKTMVFATSVDHAYGLNQAFRDAGIRSNYVASQRHDAADDDAIFTSFRKGDLEVLVSIAMLTEGFDAPATNSVFLTRPTGSLILLKQMIGRGMRGPRAGGEPTVRLVSFNDHWDRFTNWLDPIHLYDQPIVALDPAGKAQRLTTDGVPWQVIREFSKLAQQPHPYADLGPAIGWYDVPIVEMTDVASRAILVWNHQLPGYEEMIRSARRGDLRTRALHRYFEDVPDPLPTKQELRDFARYLRKGGKPVLLRFDDIDIYTPERVAERLRDEPAFTVSSTAEALFDSYPAVRSEYGNLDAYLAAIHRSLDRTSLKRPSFDDHDSRLVDLRKRLPRGRHDLENILKQTAKDHRALLEEAAGHANRNVTPIPKIRWSNRRAKSTWAFHRHHDSPLGCGIVVNRILQSSAVKGETLDFLLYHELLHHALGNAEAHSSTFREFEKRHPGYVDADADLSSLVDRYTVDMD